MSAQALRCAYCDKPLQVSRFGVLAWRTGKDFVCDEFCADGISPAYIDGPKSQISAPTVSD
jgi:hypothetical protein